MASMPFFSPWSPTFRWVAQCTCEKWCNYGPCARSSRGDLSQGRAQAHYFSHAQNGARRAFERGRSLTGV